MKVYLNVLWIQYVASTLKAFKRQMLCSKRVADSYHIPAIPACPHCNPPMGTSFILNWLQSLENSGKWSLVIVLHKGIYLNYFLSQKSLECCSIGIKDVVKKLSKFIIYVEDAKIIKKHLSNILLALISAKIPLKPVFSKTKNDICTDAEQINHVVYSNVLAVLSDHPDVLQ